jgi:hypothetical protein
MQQDAIPWAVNIYSFYRPHYCCVFILGFYANVRYVEELLLSAFNHLWG